LKIRIIKPISAIGVAGTLLWIVACGQSEEVREVAQETTQQSSASIEGKQPASSVTAAETDTSGVRSEAKMQVMMDGYSAQPRSVMLEAGSVAGRIRAPSQPLDRENYQHYDDNPVKQAAAAPVSTFSIDVDTGSYANVRRMLNSGQMPRHDAVRIEEMINYFSYAYPVLKEHARPFEVMTEMAPSPWRKDAWLLHVGVQGYDVAEKDLPPANLVFLVDVSASMQSTDKIDLLKSSLKLLSKQMDANDRIAIAVYAGAAGVVLEPTPGNETAKIIQALDDLSAGGSTNGGAGVRLAYNLAEQSFKKGGINRVIIATDGDFNVGTVNFEALQELVEEKRKTGISLTTLGFGTGNYNDHLMEQLADTGNGNYAYIDTLNEAQKVLVEEMDSTLATIAKDVKIQIEFNPALVSQYRLIGYENRMLKREDFNNDKVDAGEIGAGHGVTALYEIVLQGEGSEWIDPLRYGKPVQAKGPKDELAHLRIRYKSPDGDSSRLLEWPLRQQDMQQSLAGTSNSFRFSAAVAGFGQVLRGGKYLDSFGYDDVLELARKSRGDDPFGYRGEFLKLVALADSLSAVVLRQSKE
jgi:Ca-activated chloride channel family protein